MGPPQARDRNRRASTALVCAVVIGAALAGAAGPAAVQDPGAAGDDGAHPVVEYRNGRWFDGHAFVERTMYARQGMFVEAPPAPVDSVVDLGAAGWSRRSPTPTTTTWRPAPGSKTGCDATSRTASST